MSKECLDKCPRIKAIEEEINSAEVLGIIILKVPIPIGLDETAEDRLRQAREDASNCKGPNTCERQVQKGIFRKRTVMETQVVSCGLDK